MKKIFNNSALRICMGIAVIGIIYGVNRAIQVSLAPPDVVLPPWTVHDLPKQLGPWHGETTVLDPKIAAATGASDIENRLFRNDAGDMVSVHMAMFDNPSEGMRHIPVNCYRASGWKLQDQTTETIRLADNFSIKVELMTWERESDTVLVACWYQLGPRIMQSRVDLGEARWAMRGVPKWPVMFKVLAQIPIGDAQQSKAALANFLEYFVGWLDQPSHQTYFNQWSKS